MTNENIPDPQRRTKRPSQTEYWRALREQSADNDRRPTSHPEANSSATHQRPSAQTHGQTSRTATQQQTPPTAGQFVRPEVYSSTQPAPNSPRARAQHPLNYGAASRAVQTGANGPINPASSSPQQPHPASEPSGSQTRGRDDVTHQNAPEPAPQAGRTTRRTQDHELEPGHVPSWYGEGDPYANRQPQATIDASMTRTRWYSRDGQAQDSRKKMPRGAHVAHPGAARGFSGGRVQKRGVAAAAETVLDFFASIPFPFKAGAAIVVLALLVILGVSSCSGCTAQSNNSSDEALPAAADTALEPVSFTISFAGDCTLGTDSAFDQSTSFNAKYDSVDDPSYFMKNVADIFAQDDYSVANMEGTLTTSTTRADKTFAFKGPAEYANILKAGNIEAASLANNHSHDYGDQSYEDTINALDAAGIVNYGYDRIAYADVKGIKVALIGTYELAEHAGIKDEMVANIQKARQEGAQVVTVYVHWGNEKETVPNSTQMQLGRDAIDAGADLVVGSHPHVIQGYEKYNGRYIVYSLGNFCFGGNAHPSDTDCMIFQQTFTVTGNDVATDDAINVIPCSITSSSSINNYQPTPATGSEKERIEAKIKKSSDSIAQLASSRSDS